MRETFDILLDRKIPLLIPAEIIEDYSEVTDQNMRAKTRATSLRRCLEGSIKLFYREKMINSKYVTPEKWDEYNLFDQINLIGKHFDKKIESKFHEVRKLGNAGGHFDSDVDSDEVNKLVIVINEILEDLLVKYFEVNKFGSERGVMTILSSLPPIHRVKILERVRANDKGNEYLIDKLSMAYLKSGDYNKSLHFLKELRDKNIIDENQYIIFIDKINILNNSLDKFDISNNIIDTARIFQILSTDVGAKEYEEFMHIFSVLVNGYRVEKAI